MNAAAGHDHGRVPAGADPSKPNAARIYNYMLGGKDNYVVDQLVAHRMLAVAPDTRTMAWFSRQFLLKAVQLAAENSIRQFVDIGTGIPIHPTVYEVAQKVQPSAVVACIDYDPVVYAHCNAATWGRSGVTALLADVRHPDDVVEQCRTAARIDWSQPVAMLLVGVLHYVMDHEQPAAIMTRFRRVMAPGSYLVFTHAWCESAQALVDQTTTDTLGSSAQIRYRTTTEVAQLVADFALLDPGVAPVQDWLGPDLPITRLAILGGIGRCPA
ncbi:SAM-dependent methyltransferase [Nocardia arthritidis]|uniref:SAM-dependent methyltransferase n=1 Tax=Nocardia arthritidis TaxID=228602 RepID=A0A6G9Y6E1_9NOCA|nr:SAM-dependent methyltransferase [Nocardia arthritidis]QIS08815.1 SAM-dependent methyltransferase [Nocardia arthritidis]